MDNDDLQASILMIDLDSLFDTRLGTLILNYPDQIDIVFRDDKYHNRLDDSFNNAIDKDKFYELYALRDKRTLRESTLTVIIDIVRDFVRSVYNTDPSSPIVYYPKIIVNMYPYDLNEDEQDIIKAGLSSYLSDKADVEMVNMDHNRLSIDFVNKNLTVLIMYEYHKWLDAQTNIDGFKDKACCDTTLFGPRLFFKEVPKTAKESDNIFTMLTNISKPFINLELLPSLFFSTFLKPKGATIIKEETKEEKTASGA